VNKKAFKRALKQFGISRKQSRLKQQFAKKINVGTKYVISYMEWMLTLENVQSVIWE